MSGQTIRIVPTVEEHWIKAQPRLIEMMEDPYRDDTIRRCHSFTLLGASNQIVAITGMARIRMLDSENYVWLYGTPLIYRYPKTFFLACKRCLESIPEAAWAWINERHVNAKRMAEELGFRPTPVQKTVDPSLSYRAYIWHP